MVRAGSADRREVGMTSNAERLEDAGFIKKTPLPEPYDTVVAELSEAEVDALVSAKQRLDSSTEVAAHGQDETPPPEEVFMVF